MAELEALADETGVWSAASDRKARARGARWCGCVSPKRRRLTEPFVLPPASSCWLTWRASARGCWTDCRLLKHRRVAAPLRRG